MSALLRAAAQAVQFPRGLGKKREERFWARSSVSCPTTSENAGGEKMGAREPHPAHGVYTWVTLRLWGRGGQTALRAGGRESRGGRGPGLSVQCRRRAPPQIRRAPGAQRWGGLRQVQPALEAQPLRGLRPMTVTFGAPPQRPRPYSLRPESRPRGPAPRGSPP